MTDRAYADADAGLVPGLLCERGEDRVADLPGHAVAALGRVRRRVLQVREPDLEDPAVGERHLARHALEDHASERVEVGRGVAGSPLISSGAR